MKENHLGQFWAVTYGFCGLGIGFNETEKTCSSLLWFVAVNSSLFLNFATHHVPFQSSPFFFLLIFSQLIWNLKGFIFGGLLWQKLPLFSWKAGDGQGDQIFCLERETCSKKVGLFSACKNQDISSLVCFTSFMNFIF